MPAGFRLAGIAQDEGDLVANHNLEQRTFDVTGQRLGLNQQSLGLDLQGTALDRQLLGIDRSGFGLDRQNIDLSRQGIAAQMGRANRDYNRFQLPALRSSFGAKGTFFSGAREEAEAKLGFQLSDLLEDKQRELQGLDIDGSRIGLNEQRSGVEEQRLGLQDAGTGIQSSLLGLDQQDLGLDREKSNLTLASGLGSLNLSKIYATNGVPA